MAGSDEGAGVSPFALRPARFPGRAPIDAYGNGGFRFADMSHKGSILILPGGIEAWAAADGRAIDEAALAPVVAAAAAVDVLLIGTGDDLAPLKPGLRRYLEGHGLYPDIMPTGAAVRTFNVLMSEGRAVAAALVAVSRSGEGKSGR